MPYMRIYKGLDGKWHQNPTKCGEVLSDIELRIGGGKRSSNDEDPPNVIWCEVCYPALAEVLNK